MRTKYYDIKTEGNTMTFTTPFFKAEKSSVLHSGIYSKEFNSMLLSGAACLFVYILTEFMAHKLAVLRYLLLVVILVTTFIVGTKVIFKEKYLEAVFNKSDQLITFTESGLFSNKVETLPFADIESVEIGTKTFAPENTDGVAFVQKISLQHGSAVPGLDQTEEFVTVLLKLSDNSEKIIFAGKTDTEPETPFNEIKQYLENSA